MSANSDKLITIRARPVITNIQPMLIDIRDYDQADERIRVTVSGHGFWSNKKIVKNGIVTSSVESPFYSKGYHERLRVFAIPRPAANRSDQYNIFSQSLCAYNLYESSVRPGDNEPTMTTKYPAFTGIEVEPVVTSENILSFYLPAPLSASFIDIVVANRAGYSQSSKEYFQSQDQLSINLTTLSIPSSGMILVA